MPPTRKSLSFLTLKSNHGSKSKENTFLYRLSDYSSTIQRRKSMRNSTLSSHLKNIVSLIIWLLLKKRCPLGQRDFLSSYQRFHSIGALYALYAFIKNFNMQWLTCNGSCLKSQLHKGAHRKL